MPDLYLDFRNRETRLLVVDGVKVVHAEHYAGQPDNAIELGQLLVRLKAKVEVGISKAHLIIPMEEVVTSRHRTQAKDIKDAEVIIRRALTSETGDQEPNFRLSRMAAEQEQQVYLAEYVSRKTVEKYIRMFKAVNVRLQTVTTPFQAHLLHVKAKRGDSYDIQIFIDIGPGSVEAVFFTPTEIIHHEFLESQLAMSAMSEHDFDDGDTKKGDKRKLYEVLNSIHGIYSHFMTAHSMVSVEKIWLSGSGSSMEGLAETLSEAIELDVELIAPGLRGLEEERADYGALDGLVQQSAVKQTVNFIPPELLKRFRVDSRIVYLVLGALYTLAMLISLELTERQLRVQKQLLSIEKDNLVFLQNSAVRSRDQAKNLRIIKDIIQKRIPFYVIFKELSNILPAEIALEGIDFKQEKDNAKLILAAATAYHTEIGTNRVLSRYVAALESSGLFGRISEPVISFYTREQEKLMRIAITCELLPGEVTQ